MGRDRFGNWRVYVDRGKPGTPRLERGGALVLMKEEVPPLLPSLDRKLTLQSLRRHNSLEPDLQDTHRLLLRWSERGGSGLPDPEADVREIHYDPLPLELQERVTAIIEDSPWDKLIRKLYFSTLKKGSLAEQLGISRAELNNRRNNALWFFKGCFQVAGISTLASPAKLRASYDLW
jgi:hypothetical protein